MGGAGGVVPVTASIDEHALGFGQAKVSLGLWEIVFPDPQPLAGWNLEVVELADQLEVAQVDTQALVGVGDRFSRVLQLGDTELDTGTEFVAEQQGLAALLQGAAPLR